MKKEEPELEPGWDINLPLPRLTVQSALIYIIIVGFLANQYLSYRLKKSDAVKLSVSASPTSSPSSKKLTVFDEELISEQKKNSSPLSVYGSQHIHADFKVFVSGQALDFAKKENYMKARFIHVDDNPQNKEDAGSVLHMHSKNVPLRVFFTSIGMKLEQNSITLQDGQVLSNTDGSTLKFYLDGKKVDELGNYTFQNLDKLLISYGSENNQDIDRQIKSITNFSKNH